jgi:hypothetical protein
MPEIPEWVWLIAVAVVMFWIVPAIAVYVQVVKMSSLELRREDPNSPKVKGRIDQFQPTNAWAEAKGFTFLGYFSIVKMPVLLAAWQRGQEPTFLCHYIVQSKSLLDFVTQFERGVGLTTNNSKDGHVTHRPPGSYLQSFPNLSMDEILRHHDEMRQYLISAGGAEVLRRVRPFEEVFPEEIQRQTRYVRSLPLWTLRSVYRFYVTRYLWNNLSIRDQHEKGKIRMPGELLPEETMAEL